MKSPEFGGKYTSTSKYSVSQSELHAKKRAETTSSMFSTEEKESTPVETSNKNRNNKNKNRSNKIKSSWEENDNDDDKSTMVDGNKPMMQIPGFDAMSPDSTSPIISPFTNAISPQSKSENLESMNRNKMNQNINNQNDNNARDSDKYQTMVIPGMDAMKPFEDENDNDNDNENDYSQVSNQVNSGFFGIKHILLFFFFALFWEGCLCWKCGCF